MLKNCIKAQATSLARALFKFRQRREEMACPAFFRISYQVAHSPHPGESALNPKLHSSSVLSGGPRDIEGDIYIYCILGKL